MQALGLIRLGVQMALGFASAPGDSMGLGLGLRLRVIFAVVGYTYFSERVEVRMARRRIFLQGSGLGNSVESQMGFRVSGLGFRV